MLDCLITGHISAVKHFFDSERVVGEHASISDAGLKSYRQTDHAQITQSNAPAPIMIERKIDQMQIR
jgi:hypothetical protein